jgi:GR25 family glycosyltransferase involved in LPS biosynthesis
MNIYYINLNRSIDRKIHMEKTFSLPKYNLKRIEAYDGNKLNEYDDIILPTNHSQNK